MRGLFQCVAPGYGRRVGADAPVSRGGATHLQEVLAGALPLHAALHVRHAGAEHDVATAGAQQREAALAVQALRLELHGGLATVVGEGVVVHVRVELLALGVVRCGGFVVHANQPLALTVELQLAGGAGGVGGIQPRGAADGGAVDGHIDDAQAGGNLTLLGEAGDVGAAAQVVRGLELVVDDALGGVALHLFDVDVLLILGDGLLVLLVLALG